MCHCWSTHGGFNKCRFKKSIGTILTLEKYADSDAASFFFFFDRENRNSNNRSSSIDIAAIPNAKRCAFLHFARFPCSQLPLTVK